jgi:hypothetical protein
MPKRKKITMLVTVTVPAALPAAAARREVRSFINNQCEYDGYVPGTYDEINMRVASIRGVK